MNTILSLFPKFFRDLTAEELVGVVAEAGLDTVNAVVRQGYWVDPNDLRATLNAFVRSLGAAGLKVHFATTDFGASAILGRPEIVSILRDCGITDVRLGYFARRRDASVPEQIDEARRQMEQMAALCGRAGIRAIYQLHHGTLFTSASAVYRLVAGLPTDAVGVELDPGNQSHEGYEGWDYAAGLLGGSICAAGIKDTGLVRQAASPRDLLGAKPWRRDWLPIDQGVTDWREFLSALACVGFRGTLVFMPFYAESASKIVPILAREVAYLRSVLRAVEADALAADDMNRSSEFPSDATHSA